MESRQRKTNKISFCVERLKSVMKERGVSQNALAEMLRVNRSSLNQRINKGAMSLSELRSVCSWLNCDVDYICGSTDADAGYRLYDVDFVESNFQRFDKIVTKDTLKRITLEMGDKQITIDKILDLIADTYGTTPLLDATKRHIEKITADNPKSDV